MTCEYQIVFFESFTTNIAGYRYHANVCSLPGSEILFIRELQNPHDPNAIAIWGIDGHKLGYLFRELAEEYASLIDAGCVRLLGRLVAPEEPDYDAARANSNPVIYVWAGADLQRIEEVCAAPVAGPPAPGAAGDGIELRPL